MAKASATKKSAAEPSDNKMESLLRQQLSKAEDLIEELRADNEKLRKEALELRKEAIEHHETLREQHLATYQLCRVLRVFPALGLDEPPLRGEVLSDGDLRALPGRVRDSLRIEGESNQNGEKTEEDIIADKGNAAVRCSEAATECLRLLIGAEEAVVEDDGRVRIVLHDEERSRHMEFWLNKAGDKMEYTKIRVQLEDEVCPDFAMEEGIEFDIDQGINFLTQILGAMHDFSLKPRQSENSIGVFQDVAANSMTDD